MVMSAFVVSRFDPVLMVTVFPAAERVPVTSSGMVLVRSSGPVRVEAARRFTLEVIVVVAAASTRVPVVPPAVTSAAAFPGLVMVPPLLSVRTLLSGMIRLSPGAGKLKARLLEAPSITSPDQPLRLRSMASVPFSEPALMAPVPVVRPMVTSPVVAKRLSSAAVRLRVPVASFSAMVVASTMGRMMTGPLVDPSVFWISAAVSTLIVTEPAPATVTEPVFVQEFEVEARLVGVPSVLPRTISPAAAVRSRPNAPLTEPRLMSLAVSLPLSVIVPLPAPRTTAFGMETPAPNVLTVRVPPRVTVASL